VIFDPFFVKYRKRSIPYFLAPIQHIVFGDAIVGAWNRPLYPINHFNLNLGYSLFSVENIALEAAGLAIFLVIVLATKSGRLGFLGARRNFLVVPPLVLLVSFVFFMFSHSWITDALVDLGILRESGLLDYVPLAVQHPLFPYAVLMHLILIVVLSAPLLLGFRTRARQRVLKESQDSKSL
jgi:hypothetical protein